MANVFRWIRNFVGGFLSDQVEMAEQVSLCPHCWQEAAAALVVCGTCKESGCLNCTRVLGIGPLHIGPWLCTDEAVARRLQAENNPVVVDAEVAPPQQSLAACEVVEIREVLTEASQAQNAEVVFAVLCKTGHEGIKVALTGTPYTRHILPSSIG